MNVTVCLLELALAEVWSWLVALVPRVKRPERSLSL